MDRCKHGHPLNAKTLRFFKQKKVLATGEVKEYSVRRCRFCTQAVENSAGEAPAGRSSGGIGMKIALCTTTIHIPHALKLMREIGPDVRFFVAGDQQDAARRPSSCCCRWTRCIDVLPTYTHEWKCSEAIGWNTLARRNIAFLEALKWGADVIY